MEIWSGFIVGLAGSLHCIGMCGPIAIALPISDNSGFKIFISRVLYNLGRAVTYALLGGLFGLFGSRIVLFGLQQDISIILGAAIIIYISLPRKIKNQISETFFYRRMVNLLRGSFLKLTSNKSILSFLWIGMLNGLLPCGFVYVGIAGALMTTSALNGVLYMALFGLGTFPIMFAASMMGRIINVELRKRINRILPALGVLLALLFILRGLNLGIPFISPKAAGNPLQHQMMHHH